MPLEIERKFLVKGEPWHHAVSSTRMSQGYLSQGGTNTVRVRIGGEKAWLTIKGPAKGISRSEYEYEIPVAEAEELLGLCPLAVVEKTRYLIPHEGHTWEVDVFHGENDGLVVAEVELADESVEPELPVWVGKEVTSERRYANSALAAVPFRLWEDVETA